MFVLSKEDAKTIIETSSPIENKFNYLDFKKMMEIMIEIQAWHLSNGISANETFYKKRDKLSNLLGIDPLYHATYEFRNAVWGFIWEDEEVVIMYSNRGLEIIVKESFPLKKVERVLIFIYKKLNCKPLSIMI